MQLEDNLGEILADHLDTIGDVVVGDAILTDNIRANGASQVTIADNLVVTGNLTVNGSSNISSGSSNPIFCGGRVNGTNLSSVSSVGRVGYTLSRPGTHPVGVYIVTFNSPAPNNAYTVSLTVAGFGAIRLWEDFLPTVNGLESS